MQGLVAHTYPLEKKITQACCSLLGIWKVPHWLLTRSLQVKHNIERLKIKSLANLHSVQIGNQEREKHISMVKSRNNTRM